MGAIQTENLSPALFITGAIFIMMVGSFLSLGVVRMFQQRKKQGFMYFALSVVSFVALVLVMNKWFVPEA